MSERKSVGLSGDPLDAFENAREAVEHDVDAGLIQADTWGGDVPDGEVVRILAESYTGDIEFVDETDETEEGGILA